MPIDYNATKIFVDVVQFGGFSAASRGTQIPVATVSRKVAELEADLGERLLERSTRSLRLTHSGATFYDYAQRAVQELQAAEDAIAEHSSTLKGRLRLSVPNGFTPLWPIISAFQARYSNVELEVFSTERRVDFIEDGVDVALRVGDPISQTAIARRLGAYRHLLVASPSFLEQHPIASKACLESVPCGVWGRGERLIDWVLNGQKLVVRPFVKANDYAHLMYLARAGFCVVELPSFMASDAIELGELVPVLPDEQFESRQLNLVYPSKRQLSHVTRTFVEFCIEHTRDGQWLGETDHALTRW